WARGGGVVAALWAPGAAVGRAVGRPDGGQPPTGPDPGPAPPSKAPPPRLRLLVPAYFYPGGEGAAAWDRLLSVPRPDLVVVIANPDSGPGKMADPSYTQVFDRARQRGLTVIGYVSTRHGKRPADEVKEDVDRWVRFYPAVQGIFLDEQASDPRQVGH